MQVHTVGLVAGLGLVSQFLICLIAVLPAASSGTGPALQPHSHLLLKAGLDRNPKLLWNTGLWLLLLLSSSLLLG